jgi:hypothetical protein
MIYCLKKFIATATNLKPNQAKDFQEKNLLLYHQMLV